MKFAKPNRSSKVPNRLKLREPETGQYTSLDKPQKAGRRKPKTK